MNAANESLRLELDEEIKAELFDAFNDLYYEIEDTLVKLKQDDCQEELNCLFRHVHTIKGNAAIVQLLPVVDYTHYMEEVMSCLRSRKIEMSASLSEIIHVGVDRLRDLHLRELYGQHFEHLHEEELRHFFGELALADPDQIDPMCQHMLNRICGASNEAEDAELAVREKLLDCYTAPVNLSQHKFDLIFFKDLAKKVDSQTRYWSGRSEAVHDWALKVNALQNSPVDPVQLSAAAYMHDIGMSWVPTEILQKNSPLTTDELELVRQHPITGYNFLIRMPGWNEAATIVLEHHERVDGTGYPFGNKSGIIHDGAKIIAIVEAFFSLINGRADRVHRKSIVRAVSEINSRVGTQFDEFWVAAFNDMLRIELRSGKL